MTGAAVAATGPLETLAGTDHKRVALRMGALAFAFFLAGGALALLMRAELAEPGLQIVSTGAYDELFKIHGSTMIYLVVTPAALALGLYLVPLQDARGAHAMRTLERLLRALALLRGAGRAPVPPPAAGEAVDPRCRELPHDRRAEALVALLLVLAGAAGAVFAVAIALGWSAQGQGLAAGAAALALAAALGLASRRVVVQETDVEQCPHRGDRGERREVRAGLRSAADGVSRRRLLAGAAGAAAAGIAAAAAAPFTALGPAVGSRVTRTPWRRGRRLVDATGRPITAASIAPGSLRTAFPEGADRRRLDTPVVVVRVDPATLDLPAGREGWAPGGLVAYSKVCTHAGCAVGMYRSPTFEARQPSPALACPCHYSVFDVRRGARVLEGPAGRPLPQLPLRIGRDGVLRAGGPLSGAPGPAFWGVRRT